MRTVKLYGELADFVGRKEIVADISNVAESIRMLVANFPSLERHMAEKEYVVCIGDTSIGVDEINDPIGKEDIYITPVIAGAGGDVGRIILGVALIAGAVYFGAAAGAGLAFSASGFTAASGFGAYALVANIGVLLVLSGIAGLLAPDQPTPEKTEDPRESFNFSGITNTNAAGVPVPIVLGRTITGSVVVSAGIDTVQVDTGVEDT